MSDYVQDIRAARANETRLIQRLTLDELLTRVAFRDRAMVRFLMIGWDASELGIAVELHTALRHLRDVAGTKRRCNECEQLKPWGDFYQNGGHSQRLCKACYGIRQRARKHARLREIFTNE